MKCKEKSDKKCYIENYKSLIRRKSINYAKITLDFLITDVILIFIVIIIKYKSFISLK